MQEGACYCPYRCTCSVDEAVTLTVARKKQFRYLSLMGGDVYDLKPVQKALENVVPPEEVQKVKIVRKAGMTDWNIDDLL